MYTVYVINSNPYILQNKYRSIFFNTSDMKQAQNIYEAFVAFSDQARKFVVSHTDDPSRIEKLLDISYRIEGESDSEIVEALDLTIRSSFTSEFTDFLHVLYPEFRPIQIET